MKFLILLLILIPTLAFGDTTAYFCNYPTWSDEGGLHESKEKMELSFIVDNETGKGYVLADESANVMVVPNSLGGISFIEITGSKNVMTTTIDEKMNSVYSLHTIFLGKLIPSQYYGKCVRK